MVSGVTRDTYLITEKNPNKKNLFHHGEKTFSKKCFFLQKIEKFQKSENVDFK